MYPWMLLVYKSLIQYKSLLLHDTFVRFPMNHMVTFKSLSMGLMTSHCKFVKILNYSITLHWTGNIHIHSSYVVCLFFPKLGKIPLPLHWSLLFSFLKALIILFSMRWFSLSSRTFELFFPSSARTIYFQYIFVFGYVCLYLVGSWVPQMTIFSYLKVQYAQ